MVQVLDDSDDPTTQTLIREEVEKWQKNGARIVYRHRVIREGYKAGNLKSAMACSYVKEYEFVAIFDADFQPMPDFLKRTVPHFKVTIKQICYSSFVLFQLFTAEISFVLAAIYGQWELSLNQVYIL